MFGHLLGKFRKSTFFEKMLLCVGISVGFVGFWLINTIYYRDPTLNWNFITAVFLWLLLIFIIILTDSSESIKEELGIIIKEHITETKLLKEEVRLLGKRLVKKR